MTTSQKIAAVLSVNRVSFHHGEYAHAIDIVQPGSLLDTGRCVAEALRENNLRVLEFNLSKPWDMLDNTILLKTELANTLLQVAKAGVKESKVLVFVCSNTRFATYASDNYLALEVLAFLKANPSAAEVLDIVVMAETPSSDQLLRNSTVQIGDGASIIVLSPFAEGNTESLHGVLLYDYVDKPFVAYDASILSRFDGYKHIIGASLERRVQQVCEHGVPKPF